LGSKSQGQGDVSASQADRTQRLARAVRAAAAAAADDVDGGLALVFAAAPGDDAPESAARLRAAAGFPSAQAARDAASDLLPLVRETLDARAMGSFAANAALGERAAAGLLMHPLVLDDRIHGVLVVGCPRPLDAARKQAVADTADVLALRFDHARMAETLAGMESGFAQAQEGVEGKSEEILKLSEALFAQDIELLRTSEKLGKVEKLKNDFIERMSRELRTPLNSIIEAIISVLTNENDALSGTAKDSLRSALDEGTAFLRTLQNILDLWRIKQGELPVEVQDVNFHETVDEAIFSVQDGISGRPLVIETQIDEHFPKIRTDLTKINQILFLLLDNAVKFTPSGRISIHARVEDEHLHCEIRDTGIGICSDDQRHIFDEFYQVDEAASQKYSGAGLGLALLRDLAVLLDGEISVLSEIGSGSTFTFSLPIQVVG
jgi:signal transduction histidine kinase